jgi:hypothetical protein
MKQDAQTIQKIEELVKKLESLAWVDDDPHKCVCFDELHNTQAFAMLETVVRFKRETGIRVTAYVVESDIRGLKFIIEVY